MSTDNKQSLPALTLAAIGVVYGDIGTSPLYTLRECLSGQFGFGVERDAVFGFLSLIFWLLIFTVSIKYITFVMRADNAGEGGILTLMSLAGRNTSARMTSVLVILGLIGGSFFYGEVVITPAISVMSAIEGLEIIAPQLDTWIVPISIIVPTLLFVIQKHGTGMVGKLFAPIMLIWFLLLAVLGARSIYANPEVLQALNPYWAVHFFLQYKTVSFIALGAVVLSITGVEALYADMGHFGKLPIRVAWFSVVLPSLVLNYFGQGALLLKHPEAIKNPFFLLAPEWALIPMLIIATLATVIASQAVISGVFSLTRQAVRLGYLEPQRLKAVACLGPVVHGLLVDPLHQGRVPEMYLDVLASRLGMHDASDEALRVELNRYSLKTQGLLGRRCPTPMLSGFWKDDPFSPEEESRLITSSSADGKLLEIPFNPVYRNFDHALRQIARWINHRFG